VRGGFFVIRSFAFALLLIAPILALVNDTKASAAACSAVQWLPISGRVLDATDGSPIPGATVFYRGIGDVGDDKGQLLNPPSLKGEVKTSPDGSYKFPVLPAGTYYVRAVAPGHFGARRMLAQQIAGLPPPPGIELPDPVFRLPADALHLHTMPDAARIKFSFSKSSYSNRWYEASAFSSDGDYFVLITSDSLNIEGQEPQRVCIVWRYDLANGQLDRLSDHVPDGLCGNEQGIALDGDIIYVYLNGYAVIPSKIESYRIRGSEVTPWPISDLPKDFQDRMSRKETDVRPGTDDDSLLSTETTKDGKFSFHFHDPKAECGDDLMDALTDDEWRGTVNACPSAHLLDSDRDLVYGFIKQPRTSNAFDYRFATLAEFNLITRQQRTFTLPQTVLNLLALQPLTNGATRVAFQSEDECDTTTTDSPQTVYDPASDTNRPSICFITIPPEQTKPAAHAATLPTLP
jgi:hypothetical protein